MIQRRGIYNFQLRRHSRDRVVQRRRHIALVVIVIVDFAHSTAVERRPEACVTVVTVLVVVVHADSDAASLRR